MPNFQGAVNEVINQAGLYSSLAGGPQDLKERIRLGKEEKIVGKQLQNVGKDIEEAKERVEKAKESGDYSSIKGIPEKVKQQREELTRISKDDLGIKERRYQLDPSQKNYDAVMKARSRQSYFEKKYSLEERQNQAMKRMSEQAQAKKTQRRKFMDYLAKQPTSLGGTVGELPKPLQKQVASQYTRSQRKEMMDRMDREANNG